MITITPNSKKAYTTKAFLKKASIYGTREYELLKKFLLENEGFTVEAKTRRKAICKTRNATYARMREYIETLPNSMEGLMKFNEIHSLSRIQPNPYKFVLAWFDATYPNARSTFEAEEAKETSEAKALSA